MKQFIPLYLRPKPFASAVAAAVASTFLLSAHAAGDTAALRTNSANNFEAETRALDEQKAALVNTPASPAIVVNAPRIDARLIALMSPEQKKSMGVKNNSTSPQGFKQGGGTISGVIDDVIQSDGMVRIDLIARGDGKALQAELAAMGMKNMSAIGRSISGDLPIISMAKMSASANLISARPSVRPVRNSGSVQSQGDSAQKSDVARNVSGANGAGVKVGILSDSYNFLKGEASGVASGDLPGDGNTNGFTTPVKVLKDFGSDRRPGSDEGRAMAEIIHDVSPGAALSFYTAFESAQDFAIGIAALADDGAKVIVDDVSYFSEPWFQDGVTLPPKNVSLIEAIIHDKEISNVSQTTSTLHTRIQA
jgi:hypothetical protein